MSKEQEVISIGDVYESRTDGTLVYKEPKLSKETGEVTGVSETLIANHTPILKEQRMEQQSDCRTQRKTFEAV